MANEEAADKGPSGFATVLESIRRPLRETAGELRKVHWPTRLDVRNLTTIILGVTFTMALILGAFDFAFDRLFTDLLQATPNLVALAVALVIVIALVILVVWTSREQRR